MERIDEKAVFSRPKLLHATQQSQVVRVNYKLPWDDIKPEDCVLKFFLPQSRIAFEKERETYRLLNANPIRFDYANPIGYGEWTPAKYLKTIGKGIKPLANSNSESRILVLLLHFVDGTPLSKVPPSPTIAASALSNLASLHERGVVHGDISPDNILVSQGEDELKVFWIDFAASWGYASLRQVTWEMERAAEFFEQWVFLLRKHNLLRSLVFRRRTYCYPYRLRSPFLLSNVRLKSIPIEQLRPSIRQSQSTTSPCSRILSNSTTGNMLPKEPILPFTKPKILNGEANIASKYIGKAG
jgi:serine/threonine protein kinase